LQGIKHLALQCLLNFHSNNHNNVTPIRIELNENVNVIHYVFQKGMIILEEITPAIARILRVMIPSGLRPVQKTS
jgi:hypothetical protein